ncbi:MAG TPA: carbohydrate kinase family protein [Actinomycetes bacterium]|nr:carbohydrate kinase family protein [Actinomycetes bacterium]
MAGQATRDDRHELSVGRIAVTGSVATDHLMTFQGRFADALIPEKLSSLSVSFLVDDLEVRRGGVGANIAFGLGVLGLRPLLVAAVGPDFDDYRSWLGRHGVDTDAVHVDEVRRTARFVCTTDADQNQIASFYPGAMAAARHIELGPVLERSGGIGLAIIGADDPDAMVNHTVECRQRGLPFAADPSQQLSSLDGDAIATLVEGAAVLFSNEYESALIAKRTGWSADDVLDRVGIRVTTLGKRGARVERRGHPTIEVGVPAEERVADPTGVGDAFRAGFLAGLAWDVGLERAAQVGCMLATYVVETVGTQEYRFDRAGFIDRLGGAYGQEALDELSRAWKAA